MSGYGFTGVSGFFSNPPESRVASSDSEKRYQENRLIQKESIKKVLQDSKNKNMIRPDHVERTHNINILNRQRCDAEKIRFETDYNTCIARYNAGEESCQPRENCDKIISHLRESGVECHRLRYCNTIVFEEKK